MTVYTITVQDPMSNDATQRMFLGCDSSFVRTPVLAVRYATERRAERELTTIEKIRPDWQARVESFEADA